MNVGSGLPHIWGIVWGDAVGKLKALLKSGGGGDNVIMSSAPDCLSIALWLQPYANFWSAILHSQTAVSPSRLAPVRWPD